MGNKVNECKRRLLVDAIELLLRFVVHAAVSQDHDATKQVPGRHQEALLSPGVPLGGWCIYR
jgi:hypothetical protein